MILATRFGDREYRSGEWGSEHLIPTPGAEWTSDAGAIVTPATAAGLPAVMAAIRLVAETVASLELCVYSGEGGDRKKRSESWQYRLLSYPSDEASRFTFLADLAASIEAFGNAYVFKARAGRRQPQALTVLNPAQVIVRRDRLTSEPIYEYWTGTKSVPIPTADLIHIRGFAVGGGLLGLSPIQLHRQSLGVFLRREQFEAKHYANDARPGIALTFPEDVSAAKAKEHVELWDSRHAGSENAGKTGAVGGGATIQTFPVSLEDAQFIESMRFSIQQVARIFRVPAELLEESGGVPPATTEQASLRFLNFSLLPRLCRIERALMTDPDLFGDDAELYPEFELDGFVRADAKTRAEVRHMQIQDGTLLVDEARAEDGRPPLPDGQGQIPQITPVGGAPNPTTTEE